MYILSIIDCYRRADFGHTVIAKLKPGWIDCGQRDYLPGRAFRMDRPHHRHL